MTPGSNEHYFSATPSGEARRSTIAVELAGRTLNLVTAGGVFSPDHLDAGTSALLRLAPPPPAEGNLLDLGCGWGPLALTLALESPLSRVWALDVNERARELTRENAHLAGCTNVHVVAPDEIPEDLRFDVIWSNPPIRVGKEQLHAILERWIPRLSHGSCAYLVVAKHLGADSLKRWLGERFAETHSVAQGDHYKGFRILEVCSREP